jgi:hypothetical protein
MEVEDVVWPVNLLGVVVGVLWQRYMSLAI